MSHLLSTFERECAAAGVAPAAALKAGGVHPSLWRKWREGGVSPTLASFEKARDGLEVLRRDASDQEAA